ncbi:serine protease HTRA2, mitochondrial-like [Uloborus diversus]|uniref:serine protease HTRA2, mitochondrial-like n=1 Tax=Uloborus diversus TaxID=327109 RepID=UPI002409106C|nr:serine protease HTRA2, mitochondrial-like [Uloborus diversus]XP_054708173.1 serine protease HTRA2, mitochondrial-like [Uloborus diversus]
MLLAECMKFLTCRRCPSLCSSYRLCANNRFYSKYETCNKGNKQKTAFLCYSFGVALGFGLISYATYASRNKRFKVSSENGLIFQTLRVVECFARDENKASPRSMFNFLADVVEKTAPSVVYIEINARHPVTRRKIPISNGSGFIVKSDGLILTNAHVVSHHGHVVVKLYDGRELDGVVENLDTETDLATVRVKAKNLPELPLGQSAKLRAGEFVIALGNPLTLSHTITAGVVSAANRQGKEIGLHKKSDYIQTDAAINVGNSGGPLVNLDGEAIGINTMKVTEGISFAIPSDQAIDFLKRTEAKQATWNPFNKNASSSQKQKYLGITMLTLTPTIVQELRERNPSFPNVDHGVMVWRVMLGSPSFEHGIQPGDVITKINGKDVFSASDVYSFLNSEDVLNLHVKRKTKELDITVELYDPLSS